MIKHTLKHIAGALGIISIIALCATASIPITNFIYHQVNWYPSEMWGQIINLLVSFFLFGMMMALISAFTQKHQMVFWNAITDALRQMARGDFNVKIDMAINERSPVAKLVNDINFAAEELKAWEAMRQEFISNVSHEIQSPLTSINGFAKALKNVELTEEERLHYLTIIEMESNRLSKISENLLKLTSLESEHHPFEPTMYHLDKQIRSVILACEPQWVEKGIEMDIELQDLVIEADRDLMGQVWLNIISNAIKFTSPDGVISIQISSQEDKAIVSISDSGIGLTEEERGRIFERFYKVDKSRTSSKGGSGLGLSIVKKIIEMHHGSINVDSTVGKGTTFELTIPLRQGNSSQQ